MKVWKKPKTEIQEFSANEYINVCAIGICDISGNVYWDLDGDGRFDENDAANGYIYPNSACGERYEITGQATIPGFNAFVASSGDWEWDSANNEWVWTGATPVFYFGGQHVTTTITPDTERPKHS